MFASLPFSAPLAPALARPGTAPQHELPRPRRFGRWSRPGIPSRAGVFTHWVTKTAGVNNCPVIPFFSATGSPFFRHQTVSFDPRIVETFVTSSQTATCNPLFFGTGAKGVVFLG